MDKDRVRAALGEGHTLSDVIQVLVDERLVKDVRPSRPSILDEEWEYDASSMVVRIANGDSIYVDEGMGYGPQIAALPDLARVAVMVWDARGGMETHPDGSRVRLLITQGEWDSIEAALKKAGVER